MIRFIYTGLLLATLQAGAQPDIQAEADGGKPYIAHTVSGGETLSSISRAYKLTVADIATFNKMNADKGLQKGQTVRIPLNAANLSQTECSSCQKVYYKVQPKEGLYRIGLNFGNLNAATLQKLNNLKSESVDIGQNLLVGYMQGSGNKAITETVATITEKETAKPKTDVVKPEKNPDTKVKETVERAEPPLVIEKSAPVVTKPKEEPKTNPVVKETTSPVMAVSQNTSNTPATGLFATAYDGKAGIVKTGTAAVFKSTSGWDDAKYYVLMNNAEPGTVIKVVNNTTGKAVYAKILGELPQIKQNENILLRISNAAATALGAGEESLNVTVNY